MLTSLAAFMSLRPELAHWLADRLGLSHVFAIFCDHCPSWEGFGPALDAEEDTPENWYV